MKKAIAKAASGVMVMVMSLSACDGGKEDATPTISKAEGEILPRSVSDDMLPYDTLQSQPPLAAPEVRRTPTMPGSPAGEDADASSSEPTGPQPSEAPDSQSQAMPDAE